MRAEPLCYGGRLTGAVWLSRFCATNKGFARKTKSQLLAPLWAILRTNYPTGPKPINRVQLCSSSTMIRMRFSVSVN